jgi:hypothetical protein
VHDDTTTKECFRRSSEKGDILTLVIMLSCGDMDTGTNTDTVSEMDMENFMKLEYGTTSKQSQKDFH